MKKFFNYAFYASLLIIGLTFTSCQDEFEKLPEEEAQQEAFAANSTTAKLIENTSSNDGSSTILLMNLAVSILDFHML